MLAAIAVLAPGSGAAQTGICPARPSPGTDVRNPADLAATGGVLRVELTMRSLDMSEFPLKICYETASGAEAPTLRLSPGDVLDLSLSNRLDVVPPGYTGLPNSPPPHDPCAGGTPGPPSTNLAFGSLALPPVCHQGESTTTTIENTDPPFRYRFHIPDATPPGLYLYQPHLSGSASLQLASGASGVLIVGGMDKIRPEIAGLPERILVIRQQFDEAGAPGDTARLSVNFQPVGYRHRPPPVIRMPPGGREFWRVANASVDAFLGLQVLDGSKPLKLRLIALDGVPTAAGIDRTTIDLPPGGRAEFVVPAPEAGHQARLVQAEVDTGPIGPETPPQVMATILAAGDASPPEKLVARRPDAGAVRAQAAPAVSATRHLAFAEAPLGSSGPTRYVLTAEGQTPQPFDPSAPPAIVTRVGAVEDWIVANRTGEAHAFTLQGMHFRLLTAAAAQIRDTVAVPAWDGEGAYPTVTLRVDFTDPGLAGRHIAACAIPSHADAGMMAAIEVAPREQRPDIRAPQK